MSHTEDQMKKQSPFFNCGVRRSLYGTWIVEYEGGVIFETTNKIKADGFAEAVNSPTVMSRLNKAVNLHGILAAKYCDQLAGIPDSAALAKAKE